MSLYLVSFAYQSECATSVIVEARDEDDARLSASYKLPDEYAMRTIFTRSQVDLVKNGLVHNIEAPH